jgi:S-adenosylmethionine decarboxylase
LGCNKNNKGDEIGELEKEYSTEGKSVHADLWGVNKMAINDLPYLVLMSKIAIERSGATLSMEPQVKQFEPNGVTVMCMLEESSFSVHSYPSRGFIAVDCYTCGSHTMPEVAID